MPGVPVHERGDCRECGREIALVWSKTEDCFVMRAHGYRNLPYCGSSYCPGTGDRPAGKPSLKTLVETMKTRPGDQPLPTTNDQPYVQDQVKDYIERRKQVGISRYGTALQPFNGRDALVDAFEEAVDLVQYLAQVIIERDGKLP